MSVNEDINGNDETDAANDDRAFYNDSDSLYCCNDEWLMWYLMHGLMTA